MEKSDFKKTVRCQEGHRRGNGRWEGRHRPKCAVKLDHRIPELARAYRGYDARTRAHKYEWLDYFDSKREKDAFIRSKSEFFKRAKNEALAAALAGRPFLEPSYPQNDPASLPIAEEVAPATYDENYDLGEHLPPAAGEESKYGSKDYWDERYEGGTSSFDWFLNYATLRPLLSRLLRRDADVLDLGLGTSTLLRDMRDDGYSGRLVGIDISENAIRAQRSKSISIEVETRDARDTQFDDETFDVVIDKGTTDAVICGDPTSATAIVAEVDRILRQGGSYLLMSHHRASHLIDDDHDNDDDTWLTTIVSGLKDPSSWRAQIHTPKKDHDFPTVYLFTKRRRSSRKRPRKEDDDHEEGLSFEIFEYDDSEEKDKYTPFII